MFPFQASSASDEFSQKPRPSPPRPVLAEFPNYHPSCRNHVLTSKLSQEIRTTICRNRTFNEITDDDLAKLNISLQTNVPVSELAPDQQYRQRPLLHDEDLQTMLDELSTVNEDAYREVLRLPPKSGKQKPKLAYARGFFGSLEDLSRSWDTSSDNYYHVSATKSEVKEGASVASWTSEEDVEMTDLPTKEVYTGFRNGNALSTTPAARLGMVKNFVKILVHRFHCRDHDPMPTPRERFVFRGVKIQSIQCNGCIARVPSDMRKARARFVEGPVMVIQSRDELRFKHNDLDDRLSEPPEPNVYPAKLVPENSIAPSKSTTSTSSTGSLPFCGQHYDLFREIGCLLILAQQRYRGTKTQEEDAGSQNAWWATKPRFGGLEQPWGSLGHEYYEDEDPSWSPAEKVLQEAKDRARPSAETQKKEAEKAAKDIVKKAMLSLSLPGHIEVDSSAEPRKKRVRSLELPSGQDKEVRDGKPVMYTPAFKKKWCEEWRKLKPPQSIWDEKMLYQQIGKDPGSEHDDVYMVTACNCHIAVVRMRVHPDYLEWVRTGKAVSTETTADGSRKDTLYVQRSEWFDMFDVKARKRLLIALWGIMSWLCRDSVKEEDARKWEQLRSSSM